jgi:hypothetical protein
MIIKLDNHPVNQKPQPHKHPTAAVHQIVAAVLRPLTWLLSFNITPEPIKPIPVTT